MNRSSSVSLYVALLLTIVVGGCTPKEQQSTSVPPGERPGSGDIEPAAATEIAPNAFEKQHLAEFKEYYFQALGGTAREVPSDLNDECREYRIVSEKLRPHPGNHPKVWHHSKKTDDVIVLVHGLTDSPYYLQAVGQQFLGKGFNVIFPLLDGHGSRFPARAVAEKSDETWKMNAESWKNTVGMAVALAQKLGSRVSIGGFSTGGTLSVYQVLKEDSAIDGGLFLFPAALDIGEGNEFLLSSALGPTFGSLKDKKHRALFDPKRVLIKSDEDTYGIGANDVKYAVFSIEGAAELSKLVTEVKNMPGYPDGEPATDAQPGVVVPVFAVHSEYDESALVGGIKKFLAPLTDDNQDFYLLEVTKRSDGTDVVIPHANVVLAEKVPTTPSNHRDYVEKSYLERLKEKLTEVKDKEKHPAEYDELGNPNPDFSDLMQRMVTFVENKLPNSGSN